MLFYSILFHIVWCQSVLCKNTFQISLPISLPLIHTPFPFSFPFWRTSFETWNQILQIWPTKTPLGFFIPSSSSILLFRLKKLPYQNAMSIIQIEIFVSHFSLFPFLGKWASDKFSILEVFLYVLLGEWRKYKFINLLNCKEVQIRFPKR